jgi:hypothetical protein
MEIKYCERVRGNGLFSTKSHNKDEVIFTLVGDIWDKPSKYSIHIGNNQHIIDKYGIYMNHSFEPTTKIVGKDVVALVDMESGEELNFDYNESEIKMSSPFIVNGVEVKGKK